MKGTFRLILLVFALVSTFGIQGEGCATETNSSNIPTGSNTSSLSPGESNVIGKTAATYSAFAGSRSTAENLATGLRQVAPTGKGAITIRRAIYLLRCLREIS